MKENYYFNLFSLLFFLNIYSNAKSDYVTFDLKTYKNISESYDEYENFFYENLYNLIYSEIPLGSQKEKYIMEIKIDNLLFTIYNYNCDIPPIDNSKSSSYSPNFANSTILYSISDFPVYGEYNTYVLENTLYIKTNNGENNTKVTYLFSPRNNSQYTEKLILRPYSCFRLGFEVPYFNPNQDIDTVDDFALNLILQFKKAKIISSYKWFIEYDSENNNNGKLVLGEAPQNYNPKKYNEGYSRTIQSKIRKDNIFYWDIEVNEIYLKNSSGALYFDNNINFYLTCSLEPNLGVIFGPSGYKNYIDDYLFTNTLKNEKKCFRANPLILNTYNIYYCKKEMKEQLKANFSSIIFNHRYLNKSFELTYDDLFLEKGEYIYFLVFFDKYNTEYWRLGKPFLKKYFFSYDLDGRTITFYEKYDSINEHNSKKNNSTIIMIVIIVVLAIIFIIAGFFIAKYLYSNRKRNKGTELIDNDEYDYDNGNLNLNNNE